MHFIPVSGNLPKALAPATRVEIKIAVFMVKLIYNVFVREALWRDKEVMCNNRPFCRTPIDEWVDDGCDCSSQPVCTYDLMSSETRTIFNFGQSWIPLIAIYSTCLNGIRNSNIYFSNFLVQNANPRADVRTSHITSLCAPYKRRKIRWLHMVPRVFVGAIKRRTKRPFPSPAAKKLSICSPINQHRLLFQSVVHQNQVSSFTTPLHIHHDEAFLLFVASCRSLCFRYVVIRTILYSPFEERNRRSPIRWSPFFPIP